MHAHMNCLLFLLTERDSKMFSPFCNNWATPEASCQDRARDDGQGSHESGTHQILIKQALGNFKQHNPHTFKAICSSNMMQNNNWWKTGYSIGIYIFLWFYIEN